MEAYALQILAAIASLDAHIQQLNTSIVTLNNHLATIETCLGTRLPAALTGSGSLKVTLL